MHLDFSANGKTNKILPYPSRSSKMRNNITKIKENKTRVKWDMFKWAVNAVQQCIVFRKSAYHKARRYHQCYSASPVVEYLKSFRRVVAMWMIVRGQSHLTILVTRMSWYPKSEDYWVRHTQSFVNIEWSLMNKRQSLHWPIRRIKNESNGKWMRKDGQCGDTIKRYNSTKETRGGQDITSIGAWTGMPMLISVSSGLFGSSSRSVGSWLPAG